jgi:hypothetical protein
MDKRAQSKIPIQQSLTKPSFSIHGQHNQDLLLSALVVPHGGENATSRQTKSSQRPNFTSLSGKNKVCFTVLLVGHVTGEKAEEKEEIYELNCTSSQITSKNIFCPL